MRLGAVDDWSLLAGPLKPRLEQFCKDKVAWHQPVEGVQQNEGDVIVPGFKGP